MTQTPKNETAAEAPLTWHAKTVWGSVGRTYHAAVTLANGDNWAFTVDQPRKGYWVARGWCDGGMKFYREGARTLKDAKAQSQAHANLAVRATCSECGRIAGHKLDCSVGRTVVMVDEGAELLACGTAAYVERYSVPADAIRRMTTGMGSVLAAVAKMAPKVDLAMKDVRGSVWRGLQRPSRCTCPTPTHRMSCGAGARPVVVWRPLTDVIDGIPDHLYHDSCPGVCCGGSEDM